jgi:hypothetical protein
MLKLRHRKTVVESFAIVKMMLYSFLYYDIKKMSNLFHDNEQRVYIK